MKVGLIGLNSQFVHSALALYYLRENAPDFAICTLKEYSVNDSLTDIFYELAMAEWDVLAFSVYIWNKEMVLQLLPLCKKTMPHTKIILGGPEPTYAPEDFTAADYIVFGALEETWAPLLESLREGATPQLPGLMGVPQFSAHWQFPYKKEDLPSLAHRLVYYETSRGCPYCCNFCLSSAEKRTAFLPLDEVEGELLFFLEAKIPVVKLVDRTFNYPPERAKAILTFLLAHYSPDTTFHFELKGELLDEEMLTLFATAPKGYFQVEIGIQTLNDCALKASHRQNSWLQTKEKYHSLGQMANVHTHFDLIAGLPYEDYHSFQYSFNEAMSIFPSHLQLGFLKLLPGTALAAERGKHGYIATANPPYEVVENRYIKAQELAVLKKISRFLERFYNKNLYPNLLRFALDAYDGTPFSFFFHLAEEADEPVEVLSRLMPEKAAYWRNLERFDRLLQGRNTRVEEVEEKALKALLQKKERWQELLPHYRHLPAREVYKHLRLAFFPVAFKVENCRLVGIEEGKCALLFDYKCKGRRRDSKITVDFMLFSHEFFSFPEKSG